MAGVFSDPGKANQVVHDPSSNTTGKRMSVVREGTTTYMPYTNGVEVVMEKTVAGDGQRLKEVRTITRVNTPKVRVFGGFGPTKYNRGLIYRPEEEKAT